MTCNAYPNVRQWIAVAACVMVFNGVPSSAADATATPNAAQRLNAPEAQTKALMDRIGSWEVTASFQPTPDAQPTIAKGIVAERRMVGRTLTEEMHPAAGTSGPSFQRLAWFQYSAVEGRWQYVSLDTRFPVGIMPAYSFDSGDANKVTLVFEPIAFVGMGAEVEGKMLRSNLVITHDGRDHDVVQQYAISSDGTGRKWKLVEYDYRRRP
jgi:hypothetical protein